MISAKAGQQPNQIMILLQALRVHQWVKNLLIFVPALMAHQLFDPKVLLQSITAFFAFSTCASAVYLINDLVDLEADRRHPRKSKRPLASGRMSKATALVLIPILLLIPLLLWFGLSERFYIGLAVYFSCTVIYSFYAKKMAVVDILLLAGLYTVRIISGGLATGIPVSNWLLVFSMFIFLSLACVKRYSELSANGSVSDVKVPGRGYFPSDLAQLSQLGTASGYISVLVLGLYITSEEIHTLYGAPEYLWFIALALLFWISRTWLLAGRNELHDDPIVFAIKDPVSYLVAGLSMIIIILAS